MSTCKSCSGTKRVQLLISSVECSDCVSNTNERITETELLRLITQAANSGTNLDQLLKDRVLENSTPPIIQHVILSTLYLGGPTLSAVPPIDPGNKCLKSFTNWLAEEIRNNWPKSEL